MLIKPDLKPEVSDAQFETLVKVAARDSVDGLVALRFADTKTVRTLTALASRGHATLKWGTVDGKRGITAADITAKGEKVLARETVRRAEVAEYERVMSDLRPSAPAPRLAIQTGPAGEVTVIAPAAITVRVDPFEVIRTGQCRQLVLPF